jgi:hypothetical protein
MTPARKRWIIFGAACGVWLAGLGSAATLTYVLDGGSFRHLTAMMPGRVEMAPGRAAVVDVIGEAPAEPAAPAVDHVRLPFIARPAAAEKPLPVSKDISTMTCSDWQELQAGSGHVQVCE